MNNLIIESCEKVIDEDFSNTSIVHVRNSIIIKNILNCDLISHLSQVKNIKSYDNIICMYASPYMKYKSYMEILDKNPNANMFWLVNDHDLEDNILLRNYVLKYNKKYNVICNNPREGYRHWILGKNLNGKKLNDWINDWHTINLNCLIFNRVKKESLFETEKSGCIYYGTYRKHRIEDMKDYNGCDYIISTSKKNQDKFKKEGIKSFFIDRLDWTIGRETLKNYKYSIYFEDKHTHTNYAYMGNRFYECLMCDVLMFFDYRCMETVKKSNYVIDNYLIVKDGKELQDKIKELNSDKKRYEYFLFKQKDNCDIILSEKKEVVEKIKSVLC